MVGWVAMVLAVFVVLVSVDLLDTSASITNYMVLRSSKHYQYTPQWCVRHHTMTGVEGTHMSRKTNKT